MFGGYKIITIFVMSIGNRDGRILK